MGRGLGQRTRQAGQHVPRLACGLAGASHGPGEGAHVHTVGDTASGDRSCQEVDAAQRRRQRAGPSWFPGPARPGLGSQQRGRSRPGKVRVRLGPVAELRCGDKAVSLRPAVRTQGPTVVQRPGPRPDGLRPPAFFGGSTCPCVGPPRVSAPSPGMAPGWPPETAASSSPEPAPALPPVTRAHADPGRSPEDESRPRSSAGRKQGSRSSLTGTGARSGD